MLKLKSLINCWIATSLMIAANLSSDESYLINQLPESNTQQEKLVMFEQPIVKSKNTQLVFSDSKYIIKAGDQLLVTEYSETWI